MRWWAARVSVGWRWHFAWIPARCGGEWVWLQWIWRLDVERRHGITRRMHMLPVEGVRR